MFINYDVLCEIMLSGLKTRDVLRCMQVCKSWKLQLSDEYFWKKFLQLNFDVTVENDRNKLEGPLREWSNSETWYCYFRKKYNENETYVIKPFPSMWKCGVVVPYELNPLSLNVQELQGLSRSLEILMYMKKGVVEFGLQCGNECSSNEGCNSLSIVLMPWVFGRPEKEYDNERELSFFTWLQNLMVPSTIYIAGEGKMNPVAEFFITPVAPGWVGGILTGEIWT
ncbi:uncharacterized protein LOC124446627 isoform X2 [Xenia sp. Carnegie-2017]|uniref:uncharacterized protein LOC124446627 isoform X2 n=1 Tax=Xenia sp. Carnegie-2017 TaxID=2897299 RepID=UPI001F04520E|nr:uncharacterized protein LOC124446627 isoform X2 [Xenia sp. Carnegie-2017]